MRSTVLMRLKKSINLIITYALLPSTMQHALALAILSLQHTLQELSGKIHVKISHR